MTPKNPQTALPYISGGKYADYVAALGPAPAGFRYLKVGEKFNNDTDYCLSMGSHWEKYKYPVSVDDHSYPCITPEKVAVPTSATPRAASRRRSKPRRNARWAGRSVATTAASKP